MNLKSEDDEAETKLDLEFRRILRIIKIYIPCIMNVDYLASYRMWLEKLSEVDQAEKAERNRYLIELCRQIQDGILEKPFLQRPAPGPLPPLGRNVIANVVHIQQQNLFQRVLAKQEPEQTITKDASRPRKSASAKKDAQSQQEHNKGENYSTELSKMKQTGKKGIQVAQDKTEESEMMVPQTPPTLEQPSTSHRKRNQNSVLREIQKHIRSKHALCDKASKFSQQTYPQEELPLPFANQEQPRCFPENENYLQMLQQNISFYQLEPQNSRPLIYCEKGPQPMRMKGPEEAFLEMQGLLKNTKQQQNFIDVHYNEDADDESSWYDLSEVSKTTVTISKLESGDSAKSLIPEPIPQRPESNTSSQDQIHERCEAKITDLIDVIHELKRQNISLNTKAEIIIQSLSDEIKLLRGKAQKFSEINAALKKNQLIVPLHWQSTLDALNKKLHKAQEDNAALEEEVSRLKKGLQEFSVQKQMDNVSTRQRLADLYNKEIEMLKQNYVRHIVDIENKFTKILIEKENVFNKKLKELKELYDKKIADITKAAK